MKRNFLIGFLIFVSGISFAQKSEYAAYIKKAEEFYEAKDFKQSGLMYSLAFQSFGGKGYSNDRYNAACSWALANNPDSAFDNLNRIVTNSNYKDYNHITTDSDLNNIHSDKRWQPLIDAVKQNKEKAEVNLDKPLAAKLSDILIEDQKYRLQLDDVGKKYGYQSKEMKDHIRLMAATDSINQIQIQDILDTRGWLGEDVVGEDGATAIFIVIQHADIKTQEKYLPMMRDAVKEGNAKGYNLALLEDRVALRQGKKQIYGSQIARENETGLFYISPLDDPDHVDQRRAEVGLEPLADYVSRWDIKWDVEQYKKDLPKYEEHAKKNRQESH